MYSTNGHINMTATASSRKLVRKQFLVSPAQIDKLSSLAASEKKSEAEIVRLAIDAFEPRGLDDMSSNELMELISQRLKEAIYSTKKANEVVSRTLKTLSTE